MKLRTIRDVDVKGKNVLLRAGLDVPLGEDPSNDYRAKRSLPTINYLIERGAKKITIIAHRGDPGGKVASELSLQPITKIILENISDPSKVNIKENLRFDLREEAGDENFARELAKGQDIFVQDAFSVLHRDHTSVTFLPKLLPSFAGLLVEEEVRELSRVIDKPKRPLVAIIGGAKIETKLPMIEKFIGLTDKILVGGKVAIEAIDKKLFVGSAKIELPVDGVKSNDGSDGDVGPKTIEEFEKIIKTAKTVLWNGSLGKTEDKKFSVGSTKIAETIVASGAHSVVGGGDTVAFLQSICLIDRFEFVSTGGGAMLEFLAKGTLPGLELLAKFG